ncbi:MAG: hypothetical protein EPN53_10935 [Acidobacteria bacterium]|nr:MAG: hypothetical protein EPN53_10935 [Acidobacteriota bacterium]
MNAIAPPPPVVGMSGPGVGGEVGVTVGVGVGVAVGVAVGVGVGVGPPAVTSVMTTSLPVPPT